MFHRLKNLWQLSNFKITEFDNKLVITKVEDALVVTRPQDATVEIIKKQTPLEEITNS